MTDKVSITFCKDYEQLRVDDVVEQSISLIGGIEKFVKPGQKVLIKPNLLSASSPQYAITTHPSVIKAVVKLVDKAGGEIIIADSPGSTVPYTEKGLKKLYEVCGILDVAQQTGVKLNWDTSHENISWPQGKIIKRIDIIKPALEADVIINLPKLKSHVFTMYSGGVKNLFGFIPGLTKPGYHGKLKTIDRFSDMLLDLFTYFKPALSIMDSIVCLEGDGPGKQGKQKHAGLIIASDDAVKLDAVACNLIGFDLNKVPTLVSAKNRELWDGDINHIDIKGIPVDKAKINNFIKPSVCSDPAGYVPNKFLNRLVHSLFTSSLTSMPLSNINKCTLCGICIKSCPQNSIKIINKKIVIDNKNCIRCYCCHEMCPYGAIDLELPAVGKFLKKVRG